MHGTGERGEIRSQEGGEVEQPWPPRKFSRRMDHASRLRITRTKFSPTSSSRIYRILGFVSLDNSPGCPPDPKFSRGFVRPFPSFVPLEIRPDGICISTDISYVSIEITLIEQLDFQCTRAPRKRLNAAIQPTTKRRNTTGNDWSNTRVCVCYIGVAIDTIRFELDSS